MGSHFVSGRSFKLGHALHKVSGKRRPDRAFNIHEFLCEFGPTSMVANSPRTGLQEVSAVDFLLINRVSSTHKAPLLLAGKHRVD